MISEAQWTDLTTAAITIAQQAYAPYSRLSVGAAALVDDGRVVVGCNVENASIGLTLCAECGLVSSLYATGGGRLLAVVCVDRNGELLAPCGRCRQLLYEHGGARLQILRPGGPLSIVDLLPEAFGPDDLPGADAGASPRENRAQPGPAGTRRADGGSAAGADGGASPRDSTSLGRES